MPHTVHYGRDVLLIFCFGQLLQSNFMVITELACQNIHDKVRMSLQMPTHLDEPLQHILLMLPLQLPFTTTITDVATDIRGFLLYNGQSKQMTLQIIISCNGTCNAPSNTNTESVKPILVWHL